MFLSFTKIVLPTKGTEKIEYTHAKERVDPYITPFVKINSKFIEDLNLTAKIIKHLGENTDKSEWWFGNCFLNMTSKAEATKEEK